MAEPTIPQVFGPDATRLASGVPAPSSGLFIPDSVFVAAGLTDPTTATAEGHFVAMCKSAKSTLTQANFDANIDQSILINDGFKSFQTRGTENVEYRIDQPFVINLAKIDDAAEIDPTKY